MERFRRYSDYLRSRYGARTYRVSVDAGFSCPVRDDGRPCRYCDPRGSRAGYLTESEVGRQIAEGIGFLSRRYGAELFLLYFQAYSNTYAAVDRLRSIYDSALARAPFRGLIVGTRPDCIDRERAQLLASYRQRGLDVWVELGLQSANDATLRRIGRGHSVARFDEAVMLLSEHRVDVAAHLILGLPGEGPDDVIDTVRHVSTLPVGGVKFHNLVLVQGTPMYDEYLAGDVRPPDVAEYRELLITALENLRSDIVVMRLTCDPPRGVRHLPERLPPKAVFTDDLVAEMERRETWQGRCWRAYADEGQGNSRAD